MRRKLTILVVGLLVGVLAIGGLAPAVSAHGGTDSDQPAPTTDAENATEAHAQYMAEWMAARMGPEGIEAFEEETGTSIESVAYAMVENMGPQAFPWNPDEEARQYGAGSGYGSQAPNGAYGPQMPWGNGYGPGMWGGFGPAMWGGHGPGSSYDNGGGYGPSNGGYDSGGHGHGMGGHGHGMGGGW